MRLPLILLILVSAALSSADEGVSFNLTGPVDAEAEAALLDATNAARRRFGLAPLQPGEPLARAARAHAQEMAQLGYFSHQSPTGGRESLAARLARAGASSVAAGENLAMLRGQPDLAKAAVDGWLASLPHRAALLDPDYTHVGFGVVQDDEGATLVTQVFARQPRSLRRAEVSAVPRGGYELTLALELAEPQVVVPRIGEAVGEPVAMGPGEGLLRLHVAEGKQQHVVLAAATERAGHYMIEDGGWATPSTGEWRVEEVMPRRAVRIGDVSARPVLELAVRLELEYDAGGPPLAVFVDDDHYRDAEAAPGLLVLVLPLGPTLQVKVGEVSGRTVTPFDAFTVISTASGIVLLAGSQP